MPLIGAERALNSKPLSIIPRISASVGSPPHPSCCHPGSPASIADTKLLWCVSPPWAPPPHHGASSRARRPVACAPAKCLTCRPPYLDRGVQQPLPALQQAAQGPRGTKTACTAPKRSRIRSPHAPANRAGARVARPADDIPTLAQPAVIRSITAGV